MSYQASAVVASITTDITTATRSVAWAVAHAHNNDRGHARLTQGQIATLASCTDRTVRTALATLRDLGVIEYTQPTLRGSTTDITTYTFPALSSQAGKDVMDITGETCPDDAPAPKVVSVVAPAAEPKKKRVVKTGGALDVAAQVRAAIPAILSGYDDRTTGFLAVIEAARDLASDPGCPASASFLEQSVIAFAVEADWNGRVAAKNLSQLYKVATEIGVDGPIRVIVASMRSAERADSITGDPTRYIATVARNTAKEGRAA